MSQFKIYARRALIEAHREAMSDVVHNAAVTALGLPTAKRFQRFIGMEEADFIVPDDRTENYTIIEVQMFTGRPVTVKRELYKCLLKGFEDTLQYSAGDLEVTIVESPRENWFIRGLPADELDLGYRVGDES